MTASRHGTGITGITGTQNLHKSGLARLAEAPTGCLVCDRHRDAWSSKGSKQRGKWKISRKDMAVLQTSAIKHHDHHHCFRGKQHRKTSSLQDPEGVLLSSNFLKRTAKDFENYPETSNHIKQKWKKGNTSSIINLVGLYMDIMDIGKPQTHFLQKARRQRVTQHSKWLWRVWWSGLKGDQKLPLCQKKRRYFRVHKEELRRTKNKVGNAGIGRVMRLTTCWRFMLKLIGKTIAGRKQSRLNVSLVNNESSMNPSTDSMLPLVCVDLRDISGQLHVKSKI